MMSKILHQKKSKVPVANASYCLFLVMGMCCSLYYTMVTLLNLMKWKMTTLVQQWENNVVIYKTDLRGNGQVHDGYEA